MPKTALALPTAGRLAARVLADLEPYCARLAVAGSLRRRKSQVGDIELVAIPRWERSGGLFGDLPVNLLWAHLQDNPHYRWVKGTGPEGRYYQLRLVKAGMQLDIFLAAPDNWGWILLMRTGSGEFSQAMLSRWKRIQGLELTQVGSFDGRLVGRSTTQDPGEPVPTPEEEDAFRLCGVPFIAPEQRTGREALRTAGEAGG